MGVLCSDKIRSVVLFETATKFIGLTDVEPAFGILKHVDVERRLTKKKKGRPPGPTPKLPERNRFEDWRNGRASRWVIGGN